MSSPRTVPTGPEPGARPRVPGSAPLAPGVGAGERNLRAEVRRSRGVCVLTGGQTGVDTLAAQAALRAGLAVHVIFPLGLRQENGPLTESRRRALRGAAVHELASPEFAYRTWTCAYLADAVALIDPAGGEGCQETARAARSLGRPLLSADVAAVEPESVAGWLERHGARVLQVAGCRGSLLAAAGCEAEAVVAAVVAGARLRQERLTTGR